MKMLRYYNRQVGVLYHKLYRLG